MESLNLNKPDALIRYLDFPGTKRPIVFLHGLGCASTFDYPIIAADPHLAGHRKLLPDLLGHGYSDAPKDFSYTIAEHARTVAQLLDHLAIKGAIMYGHSMGGSVAVMLTVARPDLVSRLLLSEANLDPGGGFLSSGVAEQGERDFVERGHSAVVDRFANKPTRLATFRGADSIGVHRSAVSLVAGTQPPWREQFYALQIPKAWIVGDQSEPEADIAQMEAQGIPVFVIANAGHDMAIEHPAGVAAAIAQGLSIAPSEAEPTSAA